MPSIKSYDPGCHLSAGDVSLDSLTSPKVVGVHIKASKTGPFLTNGFGHVTEIILAQKR